MIGIVINCGSGEDGVFPNAIAQVITLSDFILRVFLIFNSSQKVTWQSIIFLAELPLLQFLFSNSYPASDLWELYKLPHSSGASLLSSSLSEPLASPTDGGASP